MHPHLLVNDACILSLCVQGEAGVILDEEA